jgi:DNA-binding transcriptional LysR family regulator
MADLALVRSFLAVYRAGSVSGGARALGLTQPAVTKQLQAFERQVGRPLFTRLARGLSATPAAHALARAAAPHVDALQALLDTAPVAPGELAGTVHLGGPAEFLAARALPSLARVHEQGIALRVQTGLADALLALLAQGALDLVVATERAKRRDLAWDALADEEFVLVASPAWAARVPPRLVASQGAAALAEVPIVAYAEELPIVRRWWRAVYGTRLGARASIVVPDLRAVVTAVQGGAGLSVVPRYLAAEGLASGALVELHPRADRPRNRLWLARRLGAGTVPARVTYIRQLLLQAAPGW